MLTVSKAVIIEAEVVMVSKEIRRRGWVSNRCIEIPLLICVGEPDRRGAQSNGCVATVSGGLGDWLRSFFVSSIG